jgi:hypothetical protein
MDKHVTLVGALKIGLGALGILIAVIVFVAIVGGGIIGGLASGDEEVIPITATVGSLVAFFIVVLSVPSIVGGVGLLRRKPWARILVLILAVFDLMNIPIGTIVGVYTIWVLLQDETAALFTPE